MDQLSSTYEPVYGHAAVLPWEIRAGSQRIETRENLTADDYKILMLDDLDYLNCHRLCALQNIRPRQK
jgi:hypothetical protein